MATYRNRPAYAAGSGAGARFAVARAITAIAALVVGIIVVAVVLKLLGASSSNQIVSAIEDAGRWLTTPFHGLFSLHGNWTMIVNWGLAALVYMVVARVIARVIAR